MRSPVAVQVKDQHGVVLLVRVLTTGEHVFTTRLKSRQLDDVEILPGEKGFDTKRMRYLERTSEETIATFCKRGTHTAEIPTDDLKDAVARYNGVTVVLKITTV